MLKNTALFGLAILLIPTAAFAGLKDLRTDDLVGVGSLQFQLIGPESAPNVVGSWTLIRPGNQRTEGDEANYTFPELDAGIYIFSTTLPQGAEANIELLLNGKLIDSLDTPQVFIPIDGSDAFIIKVHYTYTRIGKVAVTSVPAGLSYTLKGPNDSEVRGVTPTSYEGSPEGQYTAYFDEIEGCGGLPAQSDRLTKDSRVTLQVTVVCDSLKDSDIGKQQDMALEHVSVTIDGKMVVFTDVKTKAWFAPYVHKVAKAAIITGYKDRSGNPEGIFGPNNNVMIAELSKLAHKMSGVDEGQIRVPVINKRAGGQWFERYFASAEQRWWEVWRDRRVDPSRSATRGEVIATVLRALNVRTTWAEGKTFGDVMPTHKYANAIETAATDGLVDSGGNFRPDDPINRAEIAKIVANAIDLYIENTLEQQGDDY